MIRRWEMAFWTLLAGTTTYACGFSCADYGSPNMPYEAFTDYYFDPMTEGTSDIADLLENYDIPMDLESEATEDPEEEDGEEDVLEDAEDVEDEE